ncbi:hypothetical protein [Lentzea sp.]|uniref:NACHT domain-containing protein n=1 Tax=Lentzea sp. TaxID=56099 RepID=UPI002ED69839
MGGRALLRTLLGVAVLPVFIAVSVNAATETEFPGPLRLVQQHSWQAVLFGLIATMLYVVWEVRSRWPQPDALTKAEQLRLQGRLRSETERIWLKGVLAESLREELRVELSLKTDRSKVTHPLHLLSRDKQELLTGVSPVEVYDRCGDRLLILGVPGAGKTTMLLELAQGLIARKHTPVVLNLSSWPSGTGIFEEWVVAELQRFYDLSESEARSVITNRLATLLFDGLDEVPAMRKCAAALNAFRDSHREVPVVVTCRVEAYDEQVQTVLSLAGAVQILPLTPTEADAWMKSLGPGLDYLRAEMKVDEGLRELLVTPLTLNIAALAYLDRPVVGFTGRDSLFAAYTQRMLDRPRAPLADGPDFAELDVRRWLSFFARSPSAIGPWVATRFRAQSVGLDNIDWSRLRASLLALSAPMALLSGGTALLFASWWAAPLVAVVTAATAWIRADAPHWFTGEPDSAMRREDARRDLAGVGLAALHAVIVIVVMIVAVHWMSGFSASWYWWLIPGLLLLVITSYGSYHFHIATVRVFLAAVDAADGVYEAVARRTAGAVVALLVGGLAAGIAGGAVAGSASAIGQYLLFDRDLSAWHFLVLLCAPLLLGSAGGLVLTAQHAVCDAFTPRIVYRQLAKTGVMPPHLGQFLEWAKDRLLLRRTGEEYVFVHLTYRDWWAKQPGTAP